MTFFLALLNYIHLRKRRRVQPINTIEWTEIKRLERILDNNSNMICSKKFSFGNRKPYEILLAENWEDYQHLLR